MLALTSTFLQIYLARTPHEQKESCAAAILRMGSEQLRIVTEVGSEEDMHIGEIMTADSANGIGIRLTIFVSGCLNHCPGCFQPQTWDFDYGKPYTREMEDQILEELSKPFYDGLTLLGGDPMELPNQKDLYALLQRIHEELPARTVWAYTGYLYDRDLVPGGKRYIEGITDPYLDLIDVLVDGPFVEAQKKVTLNFRGSANQRIIELKKTRKTGQIVLSALNN